MLRLSLLICRCEQCEYESEVYLNGQKFASSRDPCLHCHCSVRVFCYMIFLRLEF